MPSVGIAPMCLMDEPCTYPLSARNNMRLMMKGDMAFFYHSNCKVPGIAGTMEIVQEHSVDGKLHASLHGLLSHLCSSTPSR